jgi:hypothetical protein
MRNLATSAKRETLAAKRTLAEIERSSPHRARHRGRRPLNAPETVTKAAEVMRGLIDRIVLTPVAGELRTELHGDLAVLARCAQEGERRSAGNPARISVVAGARNHLNLLFNAPRLVAA